MHLILIAPGLLAQSHEALGAGRALARLAFAACTPRVQTAGIATAMLDALDAPPSTPIAPLAALGAGMRDGDDYVLAADPVLLVADRDDVVLVQRIDDLEDGDVAALVATLNRHFAGDGLEFVAIRRDAWFAKSARARAVETTPFDAARARGVFPHLPRGNDGAIWRRWQNEIGMLLHEHPVNVARQHAGEPAVTGIWFWGGGRLRDAVGLPVVTVAAANGRVGDVARGVARHAAGRDDPLQPTVSTQQVLAELHRKNAGAQAQSIVVTQAIADGSAVGTFDAQWLGPALDLLDAERIGRITLVADGNGVAMSWTATRPSWWARVAARVRRRPFVVPPPPRP